MTDNLTESSYEAEFVASLRASPIVRIEGASYSFSTRSESTHGVDTRFNLSEPGVVFFVQFKIPEKITDKRKRGLEKICNKKISSSGYTISLYRRKKYLQHRLLMHAERSNYPNPVYYSSPKYDNLEGLDKAAERRSVHSESAFFSPNEIGVLKGNKNYKINFFSREKSAFISPTDDQIYMYSFNEIIIPFYRDGENSKTTIRSNVDNFFSYYYGTTVSELIDGLKESPDRDKHMGLQYVDAHNNSMTKNQIDQESDSIRLYMLDHIAKQINALVIFARRHRD